MKMKGAFNYLGIETFHSEKKKMDFKSACFLQGTDVQKVFLSAETEKLLDPIAFGSTVIAELEIKTGDKCFISLVSVDVPSPSSKDSKIA